MEVAQDITARDKTGARASSHAHSTQQTFLAVQSLFSQSLLLYSLPMLTPLWEKSSENTKITETVLEAVKTEKPDFLQMWIS